MSIKQKRMIIISILSFIGVIVFDQIAKYLAVLKLGENGFFNVIPGFIGFQMLQNGNTGGAWGIFEGKMWLFYIITVIFSLIIVYVLAKINIGEKAHPEADAKSIFHIHYLEIVLVLLIGGAWGNFIDRIRLKYVIDFLCFQFIDFPIFNVADCFITISIILLIVGFIFILKDKDFAIIFPKQNKSAEEK